MNPYRSGCVISRSFLTASTHSMTEARKVLTRETGCFRVDSYRQQPESDCDTRNFLPLSMDFLVFL